MRTALLLLALLALPLAPAPVAAREAACLPDPGCLADCAPGCAAADAATRTPLEVRRCPHPAWGWQVYVGGHGPFTDCFTLP